MCVNKFHRKPHFIPCSHGWFGHNLQLSIRHLKNINLEIAKVTFNKYQSYGPTNTDSGKLEMLAYGSHKAS